MAARLVARGLLMHLDRVSTPGASEDAMEYEGFRFPPEER